jgi:predicted nucleic acid binding AN1-type Zn finger protein
MEFDDLGARCTLCKRQDYLPITCHLCEKVFCKEHSHTHGCLVKRDNPIKKKRKKKNQTRCGFCGKAISPPFVIHCASCMEPFCIPHRNPEVHGCGITKSLTQSVKKKNKSDINNSNKYCQSCVIL